MNSKFWQVVGDVAILLVNVAAFLFVAVLGLCLMTLPKK